MNKENTNFLNRFNGKINHMTKNGQIQSSFHMPQTILLKPCTSLYKQQSLFCNSNQAYTMENTPILKSIKSESKYKISVYNLNTSLKQTKQAENKKLVFNSKKQEDKHKLINIGINSLNSLNKSYQDERGGESKRFNSLSWNFPDKDSAQFFRELDSLDFKKAKKTFHQY